MFPFGSLPENLAAFCRILRRDHGFRIGPGELRDAARALEVIDVRDERAVRDALRPLLSATFDEVAVFDRAFVDFFLGRPAGTPQDQMPSTRREPGSDADGPEAMPEREQRARPASADADEVSETASGDIAAFETSENAAEDATPVARSSYSPIAVDSVDAPALAPVDAAWREAARSLVRRLQLGLSRRWRPSRRGRRFDLRRTLRASLQTGAEALAPRWLRRPRRAPRFVLLLDGSRSMAAYAQSALRTAIAIASVTARVDVFTFSTALERVTDEVRRAAAGQPGRLASVGHAWGGGTSIGACLREFLRRFGERLVGRDTIVIIASDGLDVGGPELLRDAMRELHRRSAAVVWLNPLLETPGYEPTASGMRAARPYVTTFDSVGDAAGLARLARIVRSRP
jgi:uncharacterized protein with von Willebrand factor type A (vWA) domain